MSDDQIQGLFDKIEPSTINEVAKQSSKRTAMAAFREEMEKKPQTDQGNEEQGRLTRKQPNARKAKMSISTKKLWFSGLAACCILAVGTLSFKPSIPTTGLMEEVSDIVMNDVAEFDAVAPEPTAKEERVAQSPDSMVDKLRLESKHQEVLEEVAVQGAVSLQKAKMTAKKDFAVSGSAERGNRHQPAAAILPDVDAYQPPMLENRNDFKKFNENAIQNTQKNPVSTFSIDVDTASYSFMRRQLNRGVFPPRGSVRVEELINYFDYPYALPKDKSTPFKPSITVTDSPWSESNKLVHIGIKGYNIPEAMQPDSNLVFLLDVSGSMGAADKLPLVKQSLGILLDTLKPTDTVAIVVYAGAAGAVLEPTQVKYKDKILSALGRLNAGGSTAGAAGLDLAYQLAEQNFKKESVNRIILATDGDFNVGETNGERLENFVEHKREKGIYLSILGFGDGNYQDALMQTLAQNGNGIAAYIDTLSEAQKVLVQEATSSLFPIANDVKIQVEFNPKEVSSYRLIGYETRALKREDFNNDKVDAGDIGAGHTVTAIYEITPVGSNSGLVDDLRYSDKKQKIKMEPTALYSAEYGFVKLRYKRPGDKKSQLISAAIKKQTPVKPSPIASHINFATAVAAFGQLLRGSKHLNDYSYDDVIKLAQANKGEDEFGYRTEFIQLVRRAKVARGL